MNEPIEQEKLKRGAIWFWLFLFWIPILVILTWDLSAALKAVAEGKTLGLGAEAPPRAGEVVVRETGDLVRLADTPFVRRQLPDSHTMVIQFNKKGRRGPDPDPSRPARIVVCGASFATHGTSNDAILSARLQQFSGIPAANRALGGTGPTRTILDYLLADDIEHDGAEVVIWTLVERLIVPRLMVEIKRVNAHMSLEQNRIILALNRTSTSAWQTARRVTTWISRASSARAATDCFREYLPPLAFDRAVDAPVALFTLPGPGPMAFLRTSLKLHRSPFGPGDCKTVLGYCQLLHEIAKARNKTLLIVLIPDKFTVYGDRARPMLPLADLEGLQPDTGRLKSLARALDGALIQNINLQDVLTKASRNSRGETVLIYHPNDTHWNDEGIKIAARHIVPKLKSLIR